MRLPRYVSLPAEGHGGVEPRIEAATPSHRFAFEAKIATKKNIFETRKIIFATKKNIFETRKIIFATKKMRLGGKNIFLGVKNFDP